MLTRNFLFADEEDAGNKFSRKETRGNVPPLRNCAPSEPASVKNAVPVLSGILLSIEEIIFTMLRVGKPLEHVGPCASYGEIGHRESDWGSVVVIRPTTEPRRQIYVG